MTPPAQGERHAPRSLRELFWAFSILALQGFGGVMAVVQRELVERRRWFTREDFIEQWALAQMLPGPNVINLALMYGDRHFGLRGALVALAGLMTFPLIIVLALAMLFAGIADLPQAQGALRGMGAVAAGLIAGTGIKLVPALAQNVMGRWVCASLGVIAFVAIAWLRWPLPWVLCSLGLVGFAWAYRCLGRETGSAAP